MPGDTKTSRARLKSFPACAHISRKRSEPSSFTCPFEAAAFDEAVNGTTIGDFTHITGGGRSVSAHSALMGKEQRTMKACPLIKRATAIASSASSGEAPQYSSREAARIY